MRSFFKPSARDEGGGWTFRRDARPCLSMVDVCFLKVAVSNVKPDPIKQIKKTLPQHPSWSNVFRYKILWFLMYCL